MTLSSIREELFHHFKARIDAMFVDETLSSIRDELFHHFKARINAMFDDDIISSRWIISSF